MFYLFYYPIYVTLVARKEILNMEGIIKVKTDKGFGFISRENEEKDLFFHSNDLNGVTFEEIQIGDKVTFEVVDGEKGKSAKHVTRV